jgi:glucosyl-dolichyl phosphate glucuronosyltransferase
MTISVVICSYTEKRWDYLVAAVRSLQRQTVRPSTVIVVVDHNVDLLRRVQSQLRDVVAFQNTGSRGLAAARNAGLKACRSDFVGFLDDDAEAEQGWLEHLLVPYVDSAVIGVGGRTDSIWEMGRPPWFPPEFEWVVGGSYAGMPQAAAAVRNLHGGNVSFRREALVEIGGFDPGIGRIGTTPMGCEDTEICIRMRQRWPTCELIYAPQARILHHVPAGRARWSYYASRCYFEGKSKARVARSVGRHDALSTERTYAIHTLPPALGTNFAEFVLRRRGEGLLRATAIALGFTAAAVGYLVGPTSRTAADPTDRSEEGIACA